VIESSYRYLRHVDVHDIEARRKAVQLWLERQVANQAKLIQDIEDYANKDVDGG